jgi:hypothetical protein
MMHNPRKETRKALLGMITAAFLFAGPAAYGADPGQWNFQIYGGWYFAGDLQKLNDIEGGLDDTLEALGIEPGDDLTFGVRTGRRQTANWGWEVSLGFFDVDDASERLENKAGVDISLWLLDLSLMYYPGGGNFSLYGGIGAAKSDLKIDRNGRRVLDESNTEVSGNLGLGYAFNVGQSTFIRLDGKFRFYESDYYKANPDSEWTAAIGWNF